MKLTLRNIIFLVLCLFAFTTSAQTGEKGVTITNQSAKTATGQTWAVIVGVSKYQNLAQLNFAHKDAQAFNQYLTSKQINVPADHIKMLLNQEATSTEIYGALDWLKESVKENDKVIFYFSGHGDVEKKTIKQNGFLLAYDAPTAAYMTKGTISIQYLQDYLETYIAEQKVKEVLLIVDACRSGKLAGGMEGIKTTMQVLGKPWTGQITKILSAQEGELSLEDPKWGGGRGVFSYYLMKGIQGLANRNADHTITTGELAAYLPIVVGDETSNSQNPKIEGDAKHPLFDFDEVLLAEAKKDDRNNTMIAMNTKKGIIDELEPAIALSYQKYNDYLAKGWLLWGKNDQDTLNSAVYHYKQLLNDPKAISIRPSLKSSFLSALQKKSQLHLDTLLKGRDRHSDMKRIRAEISYAAAMVDKNHILYNYINARAIYFKVLEMSEVASAIPMYREALKLEEDAPYLYFGMAVTYDDAKLLDSAIYYYKKAQEFAPRWDYPVNNIGVIYLNEKKETEIAKSYFLKAVEANAQSALAYSNLGIAERNQGNYEKAIEYSNQALAIDPKHTNAINNLGNIYYDMKKYDQATNYYNQVLVIDPKYSDALNNLGNANYSQGNYEKALNYYQQALVIDPKFIDAIYNLGNTYHRLKNFEKAISYYNQLLVIDPKYKDALLGLGNIQVDLNNYEKAADYFNRVLNIDKKNVDALNFLGNTYSKQKEYEKAINYYNQALTINPKSISVLSNIGIMYLNQGKNEESRAYFKKIFSIDSTYVNALINIGVAYENEKQYVDAINYYKKAFALDPKNANALVNIGDCYRKQNDFVTATTYYKQALQINPQETEAYQGLTISDSANELKYYHKILSYDPNNEYAYHYMGHLYSEQKQQPIKGLALYIKAVDISPISDANNDLASALAKDENIMLSALKFYQDSLLSKGTESYQVNYIKGYLLYNKQNYKEALPYFQKAITIDPNRSQTYNMAGIVAMYLNNKPLTLSYFSKMIELDPGNPDPNYNLACFYSLTNEISNSLENLEQSFKKGYKDKAHVLEDTDLVNLRKSQDFNKLLQRYFPDNKKQ